jgi:ATP/maltotriose-dependent transcriptional regulator MalT
MAGEMAALAGWLAWDMRERATADHFYDVATTAATEVDDTALRACVLAYRSYGASAEGDSRLARRLLREARRNLDSHDNPAMYSWLAGREAEETAAVGDAKSALKVLELGMTTYDSAVLGHERPWVQFLNRDRMDSFAISTYGRLGHTEPALRIAADVLKGDRSSQEKKRSTVLVDIAETYLQCGEVEHGLELVSQAFEIALRTEYRPGIDRVSRLRRRINQWHDIAAARELEDQFRAVSGKLESERNAW